MSYRNTFVLTLIITFNSNILSAELIEANDSIFGDNAITIDTETQLEWLDLTFSKNMSFDSVKSEFQYSGKFFGYRHATEEELITLFESANIPVINGDFERFNTGPAVELINMVGKTDQELFYPEAYGVLGSVNYNNSPHVGKLEHGIVCSTLSDTQICTSGFRVTTYSITNTFSSSETVGHWLVRDSTVATPTTNELITYLVNDVLAMNLQQGISNALDHKLDIILLLHEDTTENNNESVINLIYTFIYSVEAQSGHHISTGQADKLIRTAYTIIDSLDNP